MSGGNTRDTNTAGALQNAKRSRSTAATARNDTAATSTAAGPSSPPEQTLHPDGWRGRRAPEDPGTRLSATPAGTGQDTGDVRRGGGRISAC